MKNYFCFKSLLLLSILTIGILSCNKDKGINSNSKVFNRAKFRQNLISQISASAATQPRGYCFIINQNGLLADSVSAGVAAVDVSSGSTFNMSTKTEINIASVTKMFTGIAVLQLIKARGITLNTKISNYLPAYWNSKQAIKDLTFEELLTHSSGLTQSNTSWDSIRVTAGRGLDNSLKPADVYANVNFAIFRAIIPFMNDKADAVTNENNLSQSNFESWMSSKYIEYMQDNVFTPMGISNAVCSINPSKITSLAYSESNAVPAAINSTSTGDWTEICGGGGYYLSAYNLAKAMAYIAQTTTVLDQNQKNEMDAKYLGWDNEDSPMTYAGRANGKDGALRWDSNSSGVQDAGDAGLQTLVMKFPNNVELVLVINSIPGAYRNLASFVRVAYDNAWE
jgi:CubicO group peptidase (beta-lactamase class C family)